MAEKRVVVIIGGGFGGLTCGIALAKEGKNCFVALIPALFYVFITMSFIFSEKIGFNLPLITSEIIGFILTILAGIYTYKLINKQP